MNTDPLALQPPPSNILLRRAQPDDLESLMRDCWRGRRADVCAWLLSRAERNYRSRRGESVVVYTETGDIIGYGQVTLWPRCAEISDLIVSETQRSQGYGTAMIQYLAGRAITLGATCIEIGAATSNPRAQALYQRLGFVTHRTLQMNLTGSGREPVDYMMIQLTLRK
jgi:ribosomal protein S18 acetylase RimI-like enzyme